MKSRPELAMEFLQDGEEWQHYHYVEGRMLTLSKGGGQFRIRALDTISNYTCQKVFTQLEIDRSRLFDLDCVIEYLWGQVSAEQRENNT